MPRYLVEYSVARTGELSAEELKVIAQQCLRVQQEMEAAIQWIHSTITSERMVSLYIADDEEIVREYARLCGLPIRRLSKVTAVIGPASDALN